MPYLVETTNYADAAATRERLRPEHLDYLARNMHRLLAAGAKLSDDGTRPIGSFYMLDVEDRAEAGAFMAAEPYHEAGICETVTYARWRKAIFNFARELPAHSGPGTAPGGHDNAR
jgi:uncharacterized protein YciI